MSQATSERRKKIMAELLDRRTVTVKELAESMAVSGATVRRDLKALADADEIQLVHGGAMLSRDKDYSFQAKKLREVEAKKQIGKLAATLVKDGDQIFLDSGTTCFEMAPYLRDKHGVTILANSARLALELNAPGLDVFLLGGQYRPDRMDMVGPMAMNALDQMRGYVAFIGTDGLSMDFGPSATDHQSAHLHRKVLQNATAAVLLADQSKFGFPSLFQIVDWSSITQVVTDSKPSQTWMRFFEEQEIEVLFCKENLPLTN